MSEKHKAWLKERKTYIGGSDIGAILKVSKFNTPLDIYLSKISDAIDETISDVAYWGHKHEQTIAEAYSEKTGILVERSQGVVRHPEYSYIAVNIDRWADNQNYILECKSSDFSLGKQWGKPYTNEIPNNYLFQVAFQSAVCNAAFPDLDIKKVDIAVLIGGNDFRIYTYDRDIALEGKLIKLAKQFWNKHILARVPPEASIASDLTKLYPESNGLEIQANSDTLEMCQELKNLKAQDKLLAKQIEKIQFDIKNFIKDNEILVDTQGEKLATWKQSNSRISFDHKTLQINNAEIYKQYLIEKEGARLFLIN